VKDSSIELGADQELIRLTASGDEAAFEKLVSKYQHAIFNTIHRYIGEYDVADDVAQEVFLIVWTKATTFKGKSQFSTWLYRIVVNQCLQFRRKQKPVDSLEKFDADNPPEPLQITNDHARQLKIFAVKQAIAGLPDRQRMALVLSHYNGLSYQEIAQAMEMSVASVESLIFRAKSTLKSKLLSSKK
jgi:RNA polymerase sigma-70 factor (ECF subfamily)